MPASSSFINSHHSFKSILPKHALFRAKLQIHQLSNVPLLGGQFGVKWKFRNVQSAGLHASLLAKIKAGKSTSSLESGKGKERDLGLDEDVSLANDPIRVDDSELPSTPGIYVNGLLAAESEDYIIASRKQPSPASSSTAMAVDSSALNTPYSVEPSYSDGRGVTEWAHLQDHSAKWEHTVTVVVRMDVHRETLDLHSNELKLTVLQRVVPGDPNSPKDPRQGVVRLNLAEYAKSGPVTRRYLLQQNKTNATLQMTIELEYVGGEQNYVAPPLRKGEILAQVSGLLANRGFHPARFLREIEMIENPNLALEDIYRPKRQTPSFSGLASSQSVRATEFLIETIFNPIISPSISPFTRHATSPVDEASFDTSIGDRRSTDSDDIIPIAPSMKSNNSGDSIRVTDPPKPPWWRKVGGMRGVRTPSPGIIST